MLKPQRTKAPSDTKTHWGFNETGSCFSSEIKVENSTTRFARDLVQQIREDYLAPFDVACIAMRDGRTSAFRNLDSWQNLHRFWNWPLAMSATPLEEYVRSLGGKHPWLTDEYAWTVMCDAAEKKHGLPSRLVQAQDIRDLIASVG
jgi:hypothetical protein